MFKTTLKTTVAAALLGVSSYASAAIVQFDLQDVTNSYGFNGTITVADNGLNNVTVTADISQANVSLTQGDILAFGMNILDDNLLPLTSVLPVTGTGTDSAGNAFTIHTPQLNFSDCYGAGACDVFTGGQGSPGKNFDMAFQVGIQGSAQGFLQTITFGLTGAGLDALDFLGEAGSMRVQSINTATLDDASSKLVGPSGNVPEPSILALMGLGLIGLGFARRQRNRQL